MTIAVVLQNPHQFAAPTLQQFQKWCDATLANTTKLDPSIEEITIRIVDQDESAKLNKTFRKKNGPTNVLSFPDVAMPGMMSDTLGDLALCAPIVEIEAQQAQISFHDHWAHLTVHGILHLLGYDHINNSDAVIMENLEIKILQQFAIKNPYRTTD